MSTFPIPVDEIERLEDLARYRVLDTQPEVSFDRLTRLARRILQTPIALIGLLDHSRQWYKSCAGLDATEVPRELTFCTYTILSDEPLIVTDATQDSRFSSNPSVTGPPHVRFYVGAPLISSNGFRLGTLCVIDTQPRPYPSERDILCLQDLAATVVEQMEAVRINHELTAANRQFWESEQELQEQRREAVQLKNHMDLALQAGGMGTWEWDGVSDFIDRSPVASRLFGFPHPDYSASRYSWIDQIHPDDRAEVMQKAEACRNAGVELNAEYRIVLPDGGIRWLSGRARPRVNVAAQTTGLIGICWDITDRKLAEHRLSEIDEVERGWSAASPSGMFRTDVNGVILFANPRCYQIFKSSEKDLKIWHSLIHPEDLPDLVGKWRTAIEQERELDHEHRVVCANPAVRWVHVRLVPLHAPNGKVSGFLGAIDDITATKEAQQQASALQELLQLAVDTMPQRLFWKDRNSIYQGCNKAFACDLGLGCPADIVGKSDFEVAHSDYAEHYRAADRQTITSGVAQLDYEEEVTHRTGQRRLIRSSKLPLRSADGNIIGVLATYDDITGQRKKEEELLNAKDAAESAARAKGQFLANMSHEIRTPLNGVFGMIALLLGSQLADEQRKWAETAQHSGEALLRLLNNVLDLSKAEAGKLTIESQPFNLLRTVQQCAELFHVEAHAKGLALDVQFAASTPHQVVGDGIRIRQILINFIANAVKFTAQGSISVQVEAQSVSPVDLLLQLAVEDTGIGVPPGAEEHLFQPFSQADGSTTRRFGGTGLGLSIARQLAELMGGRIGYRANTGGGSTFWIELPVGNVREVALEKPDLLPSGTLFKDRTVLIVEDNPVNQLVTSRFLAQLGCNVDLASNGREAIQLWQENPYDLILMDGQMPELDGYQATRDLRSLEAKLNRERVPIIALTAHALPGDKEHCLASGMDDYLSKPVQRQLLLNVVEFWLRQNTEPDKPQS